MLRLLSGLAILLLAFSASPAGDKDTDNPYKNAKIGDYITYKISGKAGGFAFDGSLKQMVTAKDDKTVTLKEIASLMGEDQPAETFKIDLTKPFDRISAVNPLASKAKGKRKFEKTGEGKEKLKVKGKEYDCMWIAGKAVDEAGGFKQEVEFKVWFSKEVPHSGMIKIQSKLVGSAMLTTMELTEFGSAKAKE